MKRAAIGSLLAILLGVSGVAAAQDVAVPKLEGSARIGQFTYALKCAACHGDKAQGTDNGPTFLSRIYHPGHHADESFFRAARNGVRAHHWRFGDMPPVDGLTDEQVASIVAFVRAMQRANGVF